MKYAFFVFTSYGVATLVCLLLIFWVWIDGRILRRSLADLEASGIRRRSAAKASPPAEATAAEPAPRAAAGDAQ